MAMYTVENIVRGLPPNFRQWQKRCHGLGIPPVIGVAGSRGKSTVVRLLQAVFEEARIQAAIWTDLGVEINGRRQKGEIAGWNRAVARLTEQSLDVAVQELDWSLVAAVGLPVATYPITIITNLCANNDACLHTQEARVAMRALRRVAAAVHPSGVLSLNGDDYSLQQAANATSASVSTVARSASSPVIRHLGGARVPNVWIDDEGMIVCGQGDLQQPVCAVEDLPLSQGGTATFEVTNALLAASAALSTGIGTDIVARALGGYEISPSVLPGAFNVTMKGTVRTVVDHLSPSWFLKPILRAANPRSARRQITIIGGLDTVPSSDVYEVGRLLGRTHGAVIHHSEVEESPLSAFKRGIAANAYPPVFLHLPTERKAINRAMKAVRSEDVVLFLTNSDPGPALRAVERMDDARVAH